MNRPLHDAIEAADDPRRFAARSRTSWTSTSPTTVLGEAWRNDDQLYVVDKEYVDRLLKNATGKTPGATTKPSTGATKMVDSPGMDPGGAALLTPPLHVAVLLGKAG